MAGTLPLPPAIVLLRRWYPQYDDDPLQRIRIIGGVLPGRRSDRATVLTGAFIHVLLSAALGAVFTVAVDRLAGRPVIRRAGLGTAQWLLMYYGFLNWYYPPQVRADPLWVAALTHAGFGATVAVIT
ncbi:MAG: hypothetical protein ABI401_06085 [Candidatus Dormibacter sp.]